MNKHAKGGDSLRKHTVFAYGTLRPDIPGVAPLPEFEYGEKTTVKGYKMYDSVFGYPFVVPGDENDTIVVYELLASDVELKMLDRYESEGNLYNRVLVTAENGKRGWLYVWALKRRPGRLVECGDYHKEFYGGGCK